MRRPIVSSENEHVPRRSRNSYKNIITADQTDVLDGHEEEKSPRPYHMCGPGVEYKKNETCSAPRGLIVVTRRLVDDNMPLAAHTLRIWRNKSAYGVYGSKHTDRRPNIAPGDFSSFNFFFLRRFSAA